MKNLDLHGIQETFKQKAWARLGILEKSFKSFHLDLNMVSGYNYYFPTFPT